MNTFIIIMLVVVSMIFALTMTRMMGYRRNNTMMVAVIILTPFFVYATFTFMHIMTDGEISNPFDELFSDDSMSVVAPYEEPIQDASREHMFDCEKRGSRAYIEHKANSADCDELYQDGYDWVTWCKC